MEERSVWRGTGQSGSDTVYADKQLAITRTMSPPGLALAGAIDYFNVEAAMESLALAVDADGDCNIELSGLEFCDVSGIRAIVTLAEHRNGRGRLLLHGLPSQLQRVMTIVGWSDMPGLVICNGNRGQA